MGIRRTRLEFEDQYTQVPNAWARDKRISRRARGLLVEITSHRIGWRITIAGLQEGGPEGRDAIRTGVNELIAAGYLIRTQSRAESGQMQEMEYDLCDPFAAAGKSDSGPDQAKQQADGDSTGSSTDVTADWKSDDGLADGGSPVVGESDTKKEHLQEDHREKGGVAAPPPGPTCKKHPKPTLLPCRACGDARRAWDARKVMAQAEADQAAAARREDRYPGMCPYLQCRDGSCDACTSDARSAALAGAAR